MTSQSSVSLRRRLIDALAMLMVSALSISLLLYVGLGEAVRTSERFQIERLIGQGEYVQDSLAAYLRPGLPIRQFAGFSNIADPILSSDLSVKSIAVFDAAGQPIFQNGAALEAISEAMPEPDMYKREVRRSNDMVQVFLPLRNRFETVGQLVLTMSVADIHERILADFSPLAAMGAAGSLLFAFFTFLYGPQVRTRIVVHSMLGTPTRLP